MNEISFVDVDIKDKIYVLRGKQVMLDNDLAKYYGYETKDFNRQVKNNIERFDEDFRFQLTKEEITYLSRCKNFTLNKKQGRGSNIKYLPYAFTEQGIYMLMTVLKGKKAVEQSKNLIRVFKSMKDYLINTNLIEQQYINNLVIQHDNKLIENDSKFEEIFNKFNTENIFKGKLLFKDQFYDSYSFLLDILNEAKEDIIIIDNYCDKKVLDLISNLDIKVTIISKNINNELIDKYQKQYNNLTIIQNDNFHDRFIIIDKNKGYHLGSSIKDIGNKISYIDAIDEKWIIELLKEL